MVDVFYFIEFVYEIDEYCFFFGLYVFNYFCVIVKVVDVDIGEDNFFYIYFCDVVCISDNVFDCIVVVVFMCQWDSVKGIFVIVFILYFQERLGVVIKRESVDEFIGFFDFIGMYYIFVRCFVQFFYIVQDMEFFCSVEDQVYVFDFGNFFWFELCIIVDYDYFCFWGIFQCLVYNLLVFFICKVGYGVGVDYVDVSVVFEVYF